MMSAKTARRVARRHGMAALGDAYAQMMDDARRGVRRCDRYDCNAVATSDRYDDQLRYTHPFCDAHAAEWDAGVR